jgi:hypothetical protein
VLAVGIEEAIAALILFLINIARVKKGLSRDIHQFFEKFYREEL